MKIGVRPHDLEFTSVDELASICHEHTIDGLQLVVLRTYPDNYRDNDFIDSKIQEIKSNGIDIFLLGSYFNMIHPNEETLKLGYDIFDVNTQIAKRNDIQYIGSETGSVNGDAWTYHPDNHTEESYAKLQTSIKKITEKIGDRTFLMEPVYDHVANNLEKAKDMMISDDMAITFDLANVLNTKNYVDYLEIFESFLKEFGETIKIFHFKNFVIENDAKVGCRLDTGLLDYTKLYDLVKQCGLTDVPIIVEELQGEDLFESIKFMRGLK